MIVHDWGDRRFASRLPAARETGSFGSDRPGDVHAEGVNFPACGLSARQLRVDRSCARKPAFDVVDARSSSIAAIASFMQRESTPWSGAVASFRIEEIEPLTVSWSSPIAKIAERQENRDHDDHSLMDIVDQWLKAYGRFSSLSPLARPRRQRLFHGVFASHSLTGYRVAALGWKPRRPKNPRAESWLLHFQSRAPPRAPSALEASSSMVPRPTGDRG